MKINRRKFLISGGLVGGGFLLGAVGLGGWVSNYDQRALQSGALPDGNVKMVAQWITIAPDGAVTLLSPHTEMGQGAQTGLLQIVLDEMDVDPERITVEMAPAAPEFSHGDAIMGFIVGERELADWTRRFMQKTLGRMAEMRNIQLTGGSASIRFTGWKGLRFAAAAGRQMLAQAGAEKLGVPVSEVITRDSKIIHAASKREVGYGEVAAAAADLAMPEDPKFKDPAEWRYIGKPFPRVDIPDKVFVKAVYGIDVEVPNMRYAAVAPPPITQAKVTGISNREEVEARRGVEAVILLDDVVAVVADNPWRAEQAARSAKIEYDAPSGEQLDSEKLLAGRRAAIARGKFDEVHAVGDAPAQLSGGEIIEAEYIVPFLSHSPMEPLNATVWEEGGKIHLATGVQGPLGARASVAKALGISLDEIILHPHTMGGGFGRRNSLSAESMNWLTHAAMVQREVGGAVKLIWSREADVQLSTFRPADVAKVSAKLGPDGKPVAWHTRTYAAIGVPGEAIPPYDIPNIKIETVNGEPALPFAYWRSVDASTHSFFIESFIDELARSAGEDPIAYRVSLLGKHPRHVKILEHAAKMAGWPKPKDAAPNSALGVAIFKSFGSVVAQIAEVSIQNKLPRVHRVWCAIDCGVAVNPNSVEAQMQGGIVYGLTAALYGAITMRDGQIQQSNFHNYRMLRLADAPRIEVDIVNTPDAPVGGAGEPGTPPIAPAVGNAIAALEARRRSLPFDALV